MTDAREFCLPELPIKRRVVRDHRMVANKIGYLGHDLSHGRRPSNHAVGDAGQALDEGGNRLPRIHQALIAIDNLSVTNQDGGDLRGSCTVLR